MDRIRQFLIRYEVVGILQPTTKIEYNTIQEIRLWPRNVD